jgi:hypothetical protein
MRRSELLPAAVTHIAVLAVALAVLARAAPNSPAYCSAATTVPSPQEFKGSGYELDLPSDWADVTKAVKDAADNAAKTDSKSHLDSMFLGPDQMTGVNVTIKPGSPTIDEANISGAAEDLRKQGVPLGMRTEVLNCRIVGVGGRNFFLAKVNNSGAMFACSMRQWFLIGTAGGHRYIFCFSSPLSDAEKWEPVFDRIVQSVRLEDKEGAASSASGWDWLFHGAAENALRWALIPVLVGGAVFVSLLRRRFGKVK